MTAWLVLFASTLKYEFQCSGGSHVENSDQSWEMMFSDKSYGLRDLLVFLDVICDDSALREHIVSV